MSGANHLKTFHRYRDHLGAFTFTATRADH